MFQNKKKEISMFLINQKINLLINHHSKFLEKAFPRGSRMSTIHVTLSQNLTVHDFKEYFPHDI